ncbi:MAG: adenylate/guanylate cyclase domain-containing protein, partial [Candidatus Margulisiibacteriota bacterium]
VHLRNDAIPDKSVKLILIDDASVNHLSEIIGRYPWPRGIYAPILDFLAQGGAKEIYFDILFTEEEESLASHLEFLNEIKKHSNINFAGLLTKDYPVDASQPKFLSKSKIDIKNFRQNGESKYQTIYHPIVPIAEYAQRIPMVTIEPDADGRYREIPLYITFQDHLLFNFPLGPFLSDDMEKDKNVILTKGKKIPINDHGKLIINWYPKGIQKFSFSGILSSWQSLKQGKPPIVSPNIFKNSIVIIGASAVGLHDLKSTPIHSHLPGPEIQATAISNIIQNSGLNLSPDWFNYLIILLIISLCPYYVLRKTSIKRYLGALLVPILLSGIMIVSFSYFNTILIIGTALTGFFLSYIAAIGYNSFSEYLEKQKVKQNFSMYVSPKILKELSQNYKTIQPELGKEKEVTILFSDIRNFTSLTETSPVNQIISLLNEYFDAMIEIIQEYDGTVDKFIGDAVMAFWNAPVECENHSLLAVKAAMRMQERLVELNEQWQKEDRITITTGIGINTGNCIIGNIGSRRRVNYTLIGDSVNATARLEALCKQYPDNILISQSTYDQIKDQLNCEFIDNVHVKGKKEALSIYAPRGTS